MSDMKEQCVYFCGPYKGYCGRADYHDEAGMFHGEVAGTKDVVTFQGKSLDELRTEFKASVDDYLKFCRELGQKPEKPFSGKFVARMTPELHRRLSEMAQTAGKSLNQFVCDLLETTAKSNRDTALSPDAVPKLAKASAVVRKTMVTRKAKLRLSTKARNKQMA